MLNDSQQQVIDDFAKQKVIIAPPGSGKTTTLTEAIIDYRKWYPSHSVVAITFTRAAAAEMAARLEEANVKDVDVQTIHSWSRTQLLRLADKYCFPVRVLQRPQVLQILQMMVSSGEIKINPEILCAYAVGNKKLDLSDRERAITECYYQKYVKYKRDNDLYDFTDYPLYLLNMLNMYSEIIGDVQGFFVDEFQDVDDVQLQLFDLVLADYKFYIGDMRQSIYMFRGASPEAFNTLKGFKRFTLDTNYRSHQEILNCADSFYDNILPFLPSKNGEFLSSHCEFHPSTVNCVRKYGGVVTIVNHFGQAWDLANHDVDLNSSINALLANNAIILCRTNKQVKSFEERNYFNVTTVHQAKGLEYDDVILIDDTIKDIEDLNVAYVGLTRARNRMVVAPFSVVLSKIKK